VGLQLTVQSALSKAYKTNCPYLADAIEHGIKHKLLDDLEVKDDLVGPLVDGSVKHDFATPVAAVSALYYNNKKLPEL
jgi:hypothetical protein